MIPNQKLDEEKITAELDALLATQGKLQFARNNYDENEATEYGVAVLDFMRLRGMDIRTMLQQRYLEDAALRILAALGHAPKVNDRCTARVVDKPHPVLGKPPGPGNPPIFCCLKAGHEGAHRCNHGGMTHPSFPFRESDEVEFREPLTLCAKCGTSWPCPDANAAFLAANGGRDE